MEDTAKVQLRAYVAIDRAWITFPDVGTPEAVVVPRNAGQTPAFNVQHWIHQWVARYPLDVDLPEPPEDFSMGSSILAGGGHHEMRLRHPHPIIRPWAIEELGTEEATIYVYGEIKYNDVFGTEHVTRYRLMYGGHEEVREGKLKPCETGNHMT